ncbi:MAG TPA: lysine--tRNA ligase [Acidimicrobiales bacterium]|nr:lysine--tRNA ligase [Acidimicrobiales bacterium]
MSNDEFPGTTEGEDREARVPVSEVPYRFDKTVGAGVVTNDYAHLEPGEGSGVVVRVAGRVMRSRPQGRVAFAELRDWTGAVQLFAIVQKTAAFEAFVKISLGDWIGAEGEIVSTKTGEVSILVERWVVLADARRSFGDKWRGVNDVEIRQRQREVDLWANEGAREVFLARTKVVSSLRRTLDARSYLEVETPILQPLAGGANARPFSTHYNALHADFFLRIAPELYLKRLVIGGLERVYEIGKDFRNEGLSPRHNPEFTMLEAYQAYADYLDMAELIESLVSDAALAVHGSTVITFGGQQLDLTPPWRRATMTELIEEVTSVTVSLEMDRDEVAKRAASLGVEVAKGESAGKIIYEIYEKTTESELWGPVHVMGYPIEVSPLTRVHRDHPGLVERITPVITGREIAEVYSELVDPVEQRSRFMEQAKAREAGDEEAMSVDEDFLRALEHGMPPTGGIGLGVDRLTMILTDTANIREVLFFPALRPLGNQPDQDQDKVVRDEGPDQAS